MQLILLFASACTASGVWWIYSFFTGNTGPQTLPQIIASVLPLGILLTATGIGLFTRRAWAPTVALAVCIVGFFYSIAAAAILFSNGVGLALFDQTYALITNLVPNILSYALEIVVVSAILGLILLGMIVRLIGNLRSAEVSELYGGEEHWLGYPFYLGYWNVKPLLLSLPMFFIVHLNLWLPKAMPAVAERAGVQIPTYLTSSKKITEVPAVPPSDATDTLGETSRQSADKLRGQLPGTNELPAFMDPKKKRANGKQKVEFAKFTPLGNFLWVFTSNHKLHLFDLKTYTSKSWETKANFYSEEEPLLSSDGQYFYDNKKKRIVQTTDLQERPVSNKLDERTYAMLGFSLPSTRVLLYKYSSDLLEFFDISKDEIIWSKPFGFQDLIIKGGLLLENLWWSGDRQYLIHRSNTRFYLVDLKTGEQKELTMDIAAPSFVSSVGDEMVLSGQGLNKPEPKTYFVNCKSRTVSEIGQKFLSTHFDFKAKKAYQVGLDEMQAIDAKQPSAGVSKTIKLPILTQVAVLPGTSWFYFVNGQEKQVQLFNAETSTQKGVGRVYSNTRRPDPKSTYITNSELGLVLMATKHEAEIFYPSQVLAPSPKTWAFEIPFDAASVSP